MCGVCNECFCPNDQIISIEDQKCVFKCKVEDIDIRAIIMQKGDIQT